MVSDSVVNIIILMNRNVRYYVINNNNNETSKSFGSDHDNGVGCNDKFIMSPGGRNDNGFYFNYHRFSKCSIDYLEKKIKRLDR